MHACDASDGSAASASASAADPGWSRGLLKIVYATETGTAEEFAEILSLEAQCRWFSTEMISAADVSEEALASERTATAVLWLVATAGQGEVPAAMRALWRGLLRRALPPDRLAALRCAVLGLGDSSYAHYNAAARKLDRRLRGLGAQLLLPLAEADEQALGGPAAGLAAWLPLLWTALEPLAPLPTSRPATARALNQPPPPVRPLRLLPAPPPPLHLTPEPLPLRAAVLAVPAQLVVNQLLTSPDSAREVRCVRIRLRPAPGQPLPQAGDVVWVQPRSPEAQVRALLRTARLPEESWAACGGHEEPLVQLVGRSCDVLAPPRQRSLGLLAHMAEAPHEAERLHALAGPLGLDDYREYCGRERRPLSELLADFPSVVVAPEYLLDLLPRMRPRGFSLSSAPHIDGDALLLDITVAVPRWRSGYQRERVGLCSSWLATLAPGAVVPVWLAPGSVRFEDPTQPLVLIGPGTGCAMFRAALQTRAALKAANPQLTLGEAALFFGCRQRDKDFLYAAEWQQLRTQGVLSHLFVAFSREAADGAKHYVQDEVQAQGALVVRLLQAGGLVVVCGRAGGMPREVRRALLDALSLHANLTPAEAEQQLAELQRTRRYLVEVWD